MGRIYLIGYMASGKSTVAKLLAEKLKMEFIDMDDLIEQRADMSVSAIFSRYGESAFRQLEASALYQCSKMNNLVIATGGGAPCFHEGINHMNESATTIYLESSPELIVTRLQEEKNSRPLVASKSDQELLSYVKAHLSNRKHYYELSNHKIDASQTPQDIVVQITSLIGA